VRLSNKAYDVIKWLITIGLPAVGAVYWAMVEVWDFPRVTGVNGTINSIIVTLGMLIGYSTRKYKQREESPDGDLIVTDDEGEKYLSLAVNQSIDALTSKDAVRLIVVDKSDLTT